MPSGHHNNYPKREKKWNWKGGKYILKGYVFILKPEHPNAHPDGYIAEHRLVMEEHLGRYLGHREAVHHINHIKNDNRIENLELMSWSDHMRFHRLHKH